jgi:hypothetical protein
MNILSDMAKRAKKRTMTLEQKALVAMVKENPNMKIGGTQKALQLGWNDLPLFYEDNQTKLFD